MGAMAWAGCPEVRAHLYTAELYNPDADCLFPGSYLDTVSGPPLDDGGPTCDAICITDLDGDVYISGQCPPLPVEFDLTGKDPECLQAFEALALCRQCPLEGGKVSVTCDAGVEDAPADGARDAPEDSGKDAGADTRKDAPGETAAD
jgi:hypothetical protein